MSWATILLAMQLLGAAPKPHPERVHADGGQWTESIAVGGVLDGKTLAGTMRVYLPRGYAERAADPKGQKYPLVIALHGWDHSPALFQKKGTLAAAADEAGVVVVVPDMGRTIYETAFYPETTGKWTLAPGTRWVGEVVLKAVRAQYAVYGDRAHTAVVGYSTGGRGAIMLAEQYPEFAFAGAVSGTFDLMHLDPKTGEYKIHALIYGARDKFPERWQKDDGIAPERLAKLAGVSLFIAHGAADKSVDPHQSVALKEALDAAKLPVTYAMVPEMGHDWTFWNSEWGPMFAQLAKVVRSVGD